MDTLDRITPNLALATSTTLYPFLFRLITPLNASAAQFMRSREYLSIGHSTFMVSSTLLELCRQSSYWIPPSWLSNPSIPSSALDIMTASPPLTKALISFELGYLLQDLIVLIAGARLVAKDGKARSVMKRNVNWRVMGWHHLGLVVGLGIWHYRVLRGTEKGSLVVLGLLLMNASTPFGTLHWLLTKFHPERTKSIFVSHVTYLCTYAASRVYLIYGILKVYGAWREQSALEALSHLKWHCQLGTGAIATSNMYWLWSSVRRFARTYIIRA